MIRVIDDSPPELHGKYFRATPEYVRNVVSIRSERSLDTFGT